MRQQTGGARRGLWREHHGARWLLCGAWMLVAAAAHAAPTPTPGVDDVTVQVVDALSGQPLANLPIQAKRIDGDVLTWVKSATTDGAGRALLRLTGVSGGVRFAIVATPYNGGAVRSPDITAPGPFQFAVGHMPVSVVAGDGTPLADFKIILKERLADGTLRNITSGRTGATGLIIFDPPGLGDGRVYVLEALSPWDGSTKRSNEIHDAGGVTFVVGNAPLQVTLMDAVTNAPLPNVTVHAYERAADGTLTWRRQRLTNAVGRASFDLDGLGSGRVYVLRATAFNGIASDSEDLLAAGEFAFKVGALKVWVVAGGSHQALINTRVDAYERRADGSSQFAKGGNTGAAGFIRFDLPGLGQGRTYYLHAKSPADGSAKTSNDITKPGPMTFVVGNAPLRVTVVDATSGAALPGLSVQASERLADGSAVSAAWRTTDASGIATFDLAGLGSGRIYFLSCWPFGSGVARSDDLSAAGDLTFRVGRLRVTVVNGADGTPLAAADVSAFAKQPDGSGVWVAGGRTNAAGVIRFDLPGLDHGVPYYLEARSPFDGTNKRSDDLTANGAITFAVGAAPLRVRVTNGVSGDPVAGLSVTAYRRNGDSLDRVTARTTDADGGVVFDLDGLGSGAAFVLGATPYNGGTVYSDDIREAGTLELRVGTLELTVLGGADGAPLVGVTVRALTTDASGAWVLVKQGVNDAAGVIRFDLPGLGSGATYVFETTSLVDGRTKRSQEITTLGRHVFTVGTEPLVVTVRDGIGGQVLAGVTVNVREKLAGGEQPWITSRVTDANGQVSFDLDGLGDGRTYVLYAVVFSGLTSWSDDLHAPGAYTFRVGALAVHAIDGASGGPLAASKVWAYEVQPDGTSVSVASGTTDAAGIVRFDLLGLRAGRTYRLLAKSPIDGSDKFSADIVAEGVVTFVVGNAPLRIAVVDGVTGAPLAALPVTARELLSDGTTTWVRQRTADAGGVVSFDLDGLGSGRRYVLYARPFNAGSVFSDPIDAPGDVYFRLGTVPVTLVDANGGQAIPNGKLIAYWKPDSGERIWTSEGYTDAAGIVRFDLPGLSQTISRQLPPPARAAERLYVFKAEDPFGNGNRYYSGVVDHEGGLVLRVDRDIEPPFDFTPPTLAILDPPDGAAVDAAGFALTGSAADNVDVAGITATLTDPDKGTATLPVAYDAVQHQWRAAVGATQLSAGRTVTVSVTASDAMQNRTTLTASYQAIADAAPPRVTITAPLAGATVPRSGFLVDGTATDDIGVRTLTAVVDDPLLGRTVNQSLAVGADGAWSFAVLSGQVSEGRTATVTVTAADAAGHETAAVLSLPVVGVDYLADHLLNRITFGGTPALRAEVQQLGVDAFVDQQLDPGSIDDSALAGRLGTTPTTVDELQRQTVLRAVYSRRQLLEVMTWFWDNHFNTDLNKHQSVAYEVAENAAFRARALGPFRELLAASAKSPAMLVYLDNASSRAGAPNENYARELLELQTLGVDGGYTQIDVEQVARAFTGWTVVNGAFAFDAATHDTGAKLVLGHTLPAGRGVEDGEQVLDILAAHPSAGHFLCTELAQLLVADAPPAGVVDRCATEYLASGGRIDAVVRIILRSPEFADPSVFRAKIRTPFETAVFWARALDASTDASGLPAAISDMGMHLFQNPVPAGWSETGDDWINTNLLLQRFRHVNRLVRNQIAGTSVDLRAYFSGNGQTTADGIVGFLLQQLFHGEATALEYDTAVGALTAGGTQPFAIDQADAEARLQRMVGTVLSFPQAQYQ